MAKKISEIYEEYKIHDRLQMHMLRVAGVASLICDSIETPVNKEKIIEAALLHDMGNIVKSDLKYFPDFVGEELDYWEKQKNEFIKKYGAEDHVATSNILKELGINREIITLTNQVQFQLWCTHKEENDIESKIMLYADGRVAPDGILSYQARMDEAKNRYTQSIFQEGERSRLVDCGKEVEKQIFAKCKIKPEDITDEMVKPIIESLRDFVIHS